MYADRLEFARCHYALFLGQLDRLLSERRPLRASQFRALFRAAATISQALVTLG